MVPDVTVIGGGAAARMGADVLARAGFDLHHTFEADAKERCPAILGDVPGSFGVARELVASGRHVLLAGATGFSPEQLALLYAERRKAQALFVWHERRYHPGYRFLTGLIEADATWRPRFARVETLATEPAVPAAMRRHLVESLVILESTAAPGAASVRSSGVFNPRRGALELVEATLEGPRMQAFVRVGLGEAVERRETVVAATTRKAYIDELNQSVPVRLIDETPQIETRGAARWLSCSATTQDELARQQCLAFFEATLQAERAQDEADVWCRSLGALTALEESLSSGSAAVTARQKHTSQPIRLLRTRTTKTSPLPA